MRKKMNISVAMTSYNGESFIIEQVQSVLPQLKDGDELVICDDGSTDKTIFLVEELMKNEKKVKLFRNNHLGVVKNFEDAIKKCKNEIIFLSDQDDIWLNGKVEKVKQLFQNNTEMLVLHNAENFSENHTSKLINNFRHGVTSNILKSNYWGCCMAFKKELLIEILPFPPELVAHDQWIGLIAESKKSSIFIDENLIRHRQHSNNVSRNLALQKKIKFRIKLILSYVQYKMF